MQKIELDMSFYLLLISHKHVNVIGQNWSSEVTVYFIVGVEDRQESQSLTLVS
jgi:hypothetical protein